MFDCCKKCEGWGSLIKEPLKNVLVNFIHENLIQDDKIVYKEQDSVSSSISYGYKTLFAYYHENKQGRISQESLNNYVSIGIHCGSFSYKKIPYKFQYIIGVTVTLKTLSKPELNIVENVYKIKMKTFMPSVSGDNKRKFVKVADLLVENIDDYKMRLFEQIKNIMDGGKVKRAVLIFFETKQKLMQFYESTELALLIENVQIMTEEISPEEKDKHIRRASSSGQITLLTRVFGRGTDFICRGQTVIANGGVHVIQTFLSGEYSEEVQIMGRCARQGQDGSYSMVLLDQDLETYLGPQYLKEIELMRNNSTIYETLDKKRNEVFAKKYADIDQSVEIAKKEHLIATAFIESLNKNDIANIMKFLGEQNKGAESKICSNTIILMDATGSMSALLNQVKLTVKVMIERASEILKDNKIALTVFKCNQKYIETMIISSWEMKPENLRQFMENITVFGGDDYEEAIEIGLQYASQVLTTLEGMNQVILLGDAPAKSLDVIKAYRQNMKENLIGNRVNSKKLHIFKLKLKNSKNPKFLYMLGQWSKIQF